MQYGEIVQLGRHRLMCGDATNYDDIEALLDGSHVGLVLTDPPYGINIVKSGGHYQGHWGDKRLLQFGYKDAGIAPHFDEIIGDTSSDTARNHYDIIKHLTSKLIIWGGQFFPFLPTSKGWKFLSFRRLRMKQDLRSSIRSVKQAVIRDRTSV